jgi:hypothetical protein
MWGRRGKRRARLPRQLALGMLQDAMGRVEERQREPAEQGESEEAGPATSTEQPPLVPRQPGSGSAPDDARPAPT